MKRFTEYPWGDFAADTGMASPDHFAGARYDPETGLYYMRARYYDKDLGRFISEDPIGVSGGANLYVYAGDDPVNSSDPMGTDPFEPCTAADSLPGFRAKDGTCIPSTPTVIPEIEVSAPRPEGWLFDGFQPVPWALVPPAGDLGNSFGTYTNYNLPHPSAQWETDFQSQDPSGFGSNQCIARLDGHDEETSPLYWPDKGIQKVWAGSDVVTLGAPMVFRNQMMKNAATEFVGTSLLSFQAGKAWLRVARALQCVGNPNSTAE
ncbi:MAG: RHS repeat-associated core domain-containing protein [Gemmatimonadota bacterium]